MSLIFRQLNIKHQQQPNYKMVHSETQKPTMKDKLADKLRIKADKLQHIESEAVIKERQQKEHAKMEKLREKEEKEKEKYASQYMKDKAALEKATQEEQKHREKLENDRQKLAEVDRKYSMKKMSNEGIHGGNQMQGTNPPPNTPMSSQVNQRQSSLPGQPQHQHDQSLPGQPQHHHHHSHHQQQQMPLQQQQMSGQHQQPMHRLLLP